LIETRVEENIIVLSVVLNLFFLTLFLHYFYKLWSIVHGLLHFECIGLFHTWLLVIISSRKFLDNVTARLKSNIPLRHSRVVRIMHICEVQLKLGSAYVFLSLVFHHKVIIWISIHSVNPHVIRNLVMHHLDLFTFFINFFQVFLFIEWESSFVIDFPLNLILKSFENYDLMLARGYFNSEISQIKWSEGFQILSLIQNDFFFKHSFIRSIVPK